MVLMVLWKVFFKMPASCCTYFVLGSRFMMHNAQVNELNEEKNHLHSFKEHSEMISRATLPQIHS